jgi:hypothetical protein
MENLREGSFGGFAPLAKQDFANQDFAIRTCQAGVDERELRRP